MQRLDYSFLNKRYSLGQFRNVPEYVALSDCDAALKESLQDVLIDLLSQTDINNCRGFLLDYIGWLVGTNRQFFDTSYYFKINKEDVNVPKYIFFSQSSSPYIGPAGSLQDQSLKLRIKAKAACNTSKCTREENIAIIKNMTFAEEVKITNVSPMMLDIQIIGDNLFISDTMRQDIESILGNGVGIRNLTTGDE